MGGRAEEGGRGHKAEACGALVLDDTLSLAGCVTLGKLLNLSEAGVSSAEWEQ